MDGALLKVLTIGNLTLTGLEGFKLEDDSTRTPIITTVTWHNMMVVEGLDPYTVLLSVKRMREDDNTRISILTMLRRSPTTASDCLRLPNGIYVLFQPDNFGM